MKSQNLFGGSGFLHDRRFGWRQSEDSCHTQCVLRRETFSQDSRKLALPINLLYAFKSGPDKKAADLLCGRNDFEFGRCAGKVSTQYGLQFIDQLCHIRAPNDTNPSAAFTVLRAFSFNASPLMPRSSFPRLINRRNAASDLYRCELDQVAATIPKSAA